MNYHMIRTDDMLNGCGLRVVVFLSGCNHQCKNCHNPETWNERSGKLFNEDALNEILKELDNDYISGITFSGGDPLHNANRYKVYELINKIKNKFPNKTIWIYTGYTWEEILQSREMKKCVLGVDVLVDGKFVNELADVNKPWTGSSNQRVIDVNKSLEQGKVVLYCD